MSTMKGASALKSFGLVLFDGFEVLDVAGPIELLNMLVTILERDDVTLSIIAKTKQPVNPGKPYKFTKAQSYLPTHTFDDAPVLDVLIVPGGPGTRQPDDELEPMLTYIRETYHGTSAKRPLSYIFSVCTGAGLLAQAGILDGHKATTNKRVWDVTTAKGPKTHWIAKARWVTSRNVWTTSGVSAGIDGMVAWIAEVYGEDVAEQVCKAIEHVRVKDATDDPFAALNNCEDIVPKARLDL